MFDGTMDDATSCMIYRVVGVHLLFIAGVALTLLFKKPRKPNGE